MTGNSITSDTISVVPGWNLIGSISGPVDTADIIQEPPGILTTSFFGFDGSYLASQYIQPARAYWVKANAPGILLLSSPYTRAARKNQLQPALSSPRK
ncbi:MAG: hypothetical protein ACKVRP_05395 [Bacteroidota bacterium]